MNYKKFEKKNKSKKLKIVSDREIYTKMLNIEFIKRRIEKDLTNMEGKVVLLTGFATPEELLEFEKSHDQKVEYVTIRHMIIFAVAGTRNVRRGAVQIARGIFPNSELVRTDYRTGLLWMDYVADEIESAEPFLEFKRSHPPGGMKICMNCRFMRPGTTKLMCVNVTLHLAIDYKSTWTCPLTGYCCARLDWKSMFQMEEDDIEFHIR